MKSLVKIQLIALAILTLGTSVAFGATVTAVPTQVPKGAYVNGGDGDQQFIQVLIITLDEAGGGAWANNDDITITLPADIRVANVNNNTGGTAYSDEVSISATSAAVVTPSVQSASAGTIVINLDAGAGAAAGDIIMVMFPITTAASPSSSTDDYTISFPAGIETNDSETATVTYKDTLTIVDFDDTNWDNGKKQSSLRGDVYPNALDVTMVTALPDLIPEQVSLTNDVFVNGADDWDQATLAGADDDFVHPLVNVAITGEIAFRLWASQTPGLKRVDAGNAQIPIHDADEFAVDWMTENKVYFDDQSATGAGTLLSGHHLAEGNWWFYVTSSATADWVLGTSDTVEIRHHPVFYAGATNLGAESGIDYNNDDIFDPSGGDDFATVVLESGGVLGPTGALASSDNLGDVDVFWMFEDVDDNAEVHVFKSTSASVAAGDIQTAGTSPNETVTGLTSATKLHTVARFEEGDTNWVNWDIFTNDSDFDSANVYYLYIVTNDGKNQVLESLSDVAGPTQLALTVKHYPSLDFHDVYASIGAGTSVPINTGTDRFAMISWGEKVSGDQDADDTAIIKLYASTNVYATVITATGGVLDVAGATTTYLQNTANATLIATITDTSDTREQNRFMWDLRSANLTEAASYYIYAHIAGGVDNLVVQYNSDGDWVPSVTDDREFVITHGDDFIAKTPVAGVPVEVYTEDQFDFMWDATNGDPALATQLIQAFMIPKGTVLAASDYTTVAGLTTDDYVWLFPTANNGEDSQGTGLGTAAGTGTQTVIFGPTAAGATEIDTDMGGGAISAGEYDVYYYYASSGTFGAQLAIKAAGTVFFNGLTREETNLELGPRQATVTVGDTITVTIYAKDTGPDPMMLSLFLDIPSDNFSVVDQESGTDGTQPVNAENVNFVGTNLLNTLTISGSTYQINFIKRATNPSGDALATSLAIGTFQLAVTANSTSPALLDNLVSWSSSGGRVTSIDNVDGTPQSITYQSPAGNYMLARPGSITGIIDLEGRTDEGQTVAMYVVPKGSLTPITDSDFLSANGDADGTDGVDVTLGVGGTYTLSRVPTGSYDLIVRKDSYISEQIEDLDVQPLSSTTANFAGSDKILAGDAAGYDHDGLSSTDTQPDDQIDGTDISAISAAFNTSPGDSLFNVFADIDGNDTVFVSDLNLSASNQGKDADDDGDELPWYKILYQGNEKALVTLVRGNESADGITYNVELSEMAHLHGYAVEMTINREHWGIVGYKDGFASNYDSYSLSQVKGDYALFVGVILGRDYYRGSDMNALSVTLKAKVLEPDAPSLIAVTLVDAQGAVSRATASSDNLSPTEYSLAQNYPNPFNPVTSIRFSLPKDSNVRVSVYNLLGQEVAILASGAMTTGSYKVVWNALDNFGQKVSSGVYFYRLKVDNNVIATRKMLLLK